MLKKNCPDTHYNLTAKSLKTQNLQKLLRLMILEIMEVTTYYFLKQFYFHSGRISN